jgi:inner membrane protein COX18
LAHPDPTIALPVPVVIGLISLATIETSQWFVTEERAIRLRKTSFRNEVQRDQGKIITNPRWHIKGIMSGLSVGRIILAAMMPGVSSQNYIIGAYSENFNSLCRNLLINFSKLWPTDKLGCELW